MNRDVIGTSGSGDTGVSSGSSGGVCIGLSGFGSGSGSLKCSMDENPGGNVGSTREVQGLSQRRDC